MACSFASMPGRALFRADDVEESRDLGIMPSIVVGALAR